MLKKEYKNTYYLILMLFSVVVFTFSSSYFLWLCIISVLVGLVHLKYQDFTMSSILTTCLACSRIILLGYMFL